MAKDFCDPGPALQRLYLQTFCDIRLDTEHAEVTESLDFNKWKVLPVDQVKGLQSGRGESKRHAIRALSEPYPLVTIRARKMSELKVSINADKGSH